MQQTRKATSVSDKAVAASTGKTWDEWFAILDDAGGTSLNHKQLVAYLGEHYDISGWWQQMVTVGYEQERGLREKYETPGGYRRALARPSPYR